MRRFHSIEWLDHGVVRLLDQRQLPHKVTYIDYANAEGVVEAIRDMVIRGAPAIGAAAAYGLALTAFHTAAANVEELRQELTTKADLLRQSRPTAVNLFWAVERMLNRLQDPALGSVENVQATTLSEAHNIANEDIQINKQIGACALPLIPDQATILHHCNTGSLATVDYGTALGVIRLAHESGKDVLAVLDETRPRLQGARLSAWELEQYGIPYVIIVDGASGHYMRTKGVDLCVVGADRVAANGDVANKIGTYNLAVVAHENGVPFYVAAPTTTIDLSTRSGDDIAIEERPAWELTRIGDWQITPSGAAVANPAFDITPAKYVTAIITEKGIIHPPYRENLANIT